MTPLIKTLLDQHNAFTMDNKTGYKDYRRDQRQLL